MLKICIKISYLKWVWNGNKIETSINLCGNYKFNKFICIICSQHPFLVAHMSTLIEISMSTMNRRTCTIWRRQTVGHSAQNQEKLTENKHNNVEIVFMRHVYFFPKVKSNFSTSDESLIIGSLNHAIQTLSLKLLN